MSYPTYIFEQRRQRGITLQSTVLSKAATERGRRGRERERGSDLNLEDLLKTSFVRPSVCPSVAEGSKMEWMIMMMTYSQPASQPNREGKYAGKDGECTLLSKKEKFLLDKSAS